jgi:cell division septation protein DedD
VPPAGSSTSESAANLADTVEDPTLYGFVDSSAAGQQASETAARQSGDLTDAMAGESSEEPAPTPLDAGLALPDEEPDLPQVALWRGRLILALTGVSGIVMAVLLFMWMSRPDDRTTGNPREVAKRDSAAKSPPTPAPAKGQETPATPEHSKTENPKTGKADPPAPSPEAKPEPASPTAQVPPDLGPPSVEKPTPGTAKPAEPTPAEPKPEESKPAEPKPAEAKPEETKPAESMPAEAKPAAKDAADSMSSAASLRETLKAFGSVIGESPVAEGAIPPAGGFSPDLPARPPVPRPDPVVVDMESRLADVIQQIDFNEVPLVDFLSFVSDYSTIPVTLDPDVLPWLHISPETPVTARQTKVTVGDLLGETLKGLGLGYTVMERQVFVTRVDAKGARTREVPFELGDLTNNDAVRLEQIGQLIRELIAPETWKAAGGTGTLQTRDQSLLVKNEEPVLYQVLAFCEKLRVAQGLTPRGKMDPALFQLTPRTEKAQSKLKTAVTLTCPRPERLSTIVRRLAKESATEILIDWDGAGEMGWNPGAQVPCNVRNQPLSEALRILLGPLDLTYRIVDESTFQVTSRQVLDKRIELEFYPAKDLVAGGMTGEQLIDKAKANLGEDALREHGGLGVLRFDAPSQCLLAAVTQAQQQSLAALMGQLRAAKK